MNEALTTAELKQLIGLAREHANNSTEPFYRADYPGGPCGCLGPQDGDPLCRCEARTLLANRYEDVFRELLLNPDVENQVTKSNTLGIRYLAVTTEQKVNAIKFIRNEYNLSLSEAFNAIKFGRVFPITIDERYPSLTKNNLANELKRRAFNEHIVYEIVKE